MRRLFEARETTARRGAPTWVAITLAATLLTLALIPSVAPLAAAEASWTSLRGPHYDGTIPGRLFDGPEAGLEIGWKVELGSGYSGVVVEDGVVYTLFAAGEQDAVGAFDAETGEEKWRFAFGPTYPGHDGSHDGPISTPVLGNGKIFGLGAWGHLFAVDIATGAPVWETHLVDELGSVKPHYGFTVSPVLVDSTLILALTREEPPEDGEAAGEAADGEATAPAQLPATFVGLNANTGELIWEAGEERVDYQSPVVATLGGVLQVLAASETHIHGIAPANGEVLWSFAYDGDTSAMGAGSLVPLPVGDDRVFLVHARNASKMVQVQKGDDAWTAEELWTSDSIARTYMQPVLVDDVIYGMNNRIFTAIDVGTGERLWRSRDPGDGVPTAVGNHIVVLTKAGSLHVVAPSSEAYQELAQIQLFEDDAWSAVAWGDGHLFARSMGHLARIDPSRQSAGEAPSNPWIGDTDFGALLETVHAADVEERQALVDAYLEDTKTFPLVEPSGAVHFLYRGDHDDVGIVGDMIGFRREDPMTRVEGTDLFYWSTTLEPNAALTYGFIPDYSGETVPDPRNPLTVEGIFGATSMLTMPAWSAPGWASAEPAAHGRWVDLPWQGPGEADATVERTAKIYLPAGYEDDGADRYPSLYLINAIEEGVDAEELGASLDSIFGSSAESTLVVMVLPPELENRRDGPSPEDEAQALVDTLIPTVDATYRTRSTRLDRGVAGFGDGAAAALALAFSQGDIFGKVASHGATMLGIGELQAAVDASPRRPMVIYQAWGTYHLRSPHEGWDMVQYNRQFRAYLQEQGYVPTGGEIPEGFGWDVWKHNTQAWIQALFPAG